MGVTNEVNGSDTHSKMLLARAYRDGDGVKKDLGKAIALMKAAAEKKIENAHYELIDMEAKHTPESFLQAYDKCILLSKKGDHKSSVRLWLWNEMYERKYIIKTGVKNKVMNFLIIPSREYIKYTIVLMKSICLNNTKRKKRFFVLSPDLDSTVTKDLSDFAKLENIEITTIPLDISIFKGFGEHKSWPKHIYAQLIPNLFLPDDVNRILYLDVDTVVDGPLDDLYDAELNDEILIGAKSSIFFNIHYLKKNYSEIPHRINAGVVLYDIDKMRKEGINIDYYKTLSVKKIIDLNSTGETILNEAFRGRILFVDEYKYNRKVSTDNFYKKFSLQRDKTVIFHYEGSMRQSVVKPWDCYFDNQEGRYASDLLPSTLNDEIGITFSFWWKYAKVSPNYELLLNEMEIRKKFYLGPVERMRKGYMELIEENRNIFKRLETILSQPNYGNVCDYLKRCEGNISYSQNNLISKILERCLGDGALDKDLSNKSILIITNPWDMTESKLVEYGATYEKVISVDEILQLQDSIPKSKLSAFDEIINLGYDCEASFVIRKYWYAGNLNSFLFSWSLEEDQELYIKALKNTGDLVNGDFVLDNGMIRVEKYRIKFHHRPAGNLYDEQGVVNESVLASLITELKNRISYLAQKTEKLFNSNKNVLFVSKVFSSDDAANIKYMKKLYETLGRKHKSGRFKLLFIVEGKEVSQNLMDFEKNQSEIKILPLENYARYPVSKYNEASWVEIIRRIDPSLKLDV